jgi:iron complex transport system substrate-binding protein
MRRAGLLIVMALAACSQPAPEPAPRVHPTIVSLNPCSDAILAEVASPAQLLAISHYSQDPASSSMDLAKAARFRAVSGSAEEVLALRPDIVVADPFLPPATRAALEQTGVRVVTLPIARSVAESRAQVAELAQLSGRETQGAALDARIEAALAAALLGDTVRVRAIVWQAGGIVPGRDTLVADLLGRTGFELQSAAKGMGQADVLPLEALLADPPQVLFVAGNDHAQENRMLAHPALATLSDTRRIDFDSSLLWCGGPTIVRAAQKLAAARRTL